jgi:hypothetical protein
MLTLVGDAELAARRHRPAASVLNGVSMLTDLRDGDRAANAHLREVSTSGVCDDEPAPARTWVPAFCRAVGAPPPAAAGGPTPRTGRARGADNHRARALGWTPRYPSWRDGFAALRHTGVPDTRQGESA